MNFTFTLLALFILSSCVDEYGKDTLKFVENRVPGLSLKVAESGYEKKIAQGYVLEYTKLIMEARNIFSHIERHAPKINIEIEKYSMQDAQKTRAILMKSEEKLLSMKSHLLNIKNELHALDNICEKMDEYYLRSVIQQDIFNIAVPKKVEEYYVGTDMVGSAIRNIMSQFSSNNQAKQNSMMEEAISKIPSKIASVSELKRVYKIKCLSMKEAFDTQDEIKSFQRTFERVTQTVEKAINLTQRTISIVGSRIYQLAYKEISSRYGIDNINESESDEEKQSILSQIYSDFLQQDFMLTKQMINAKEISTLKQAKSEWDKSFRERSLFLLTTKNTWRFFNEKNQETIKRQFIVNEYCRLLSEKLQ